MRPFRDQIDRFRKAMRPFRYQILSVDAVRYVVCGLRFFWLTKVKGSMRSLNITTEKVSTNTVHHNLLGTRDFTVSRSHLLIRPLASIEYVRHNKRKLKVLTIGPRTEGEIYNLIAYGFKKNNIRGLDLISYSPLIDLGDMHAMPYDDSSVDIIIAGWVLAYSEDRQAAANEIIRVTKDGGIIALGASYSPKSDDATIAACGYLPGSAARITSVDSMIDLFAPAIDHVYFKQDIEKRLADKVTNMMCIFSINKKEIL